MTGNYAKFKQLSINVIQQVRIYKELQCNTTGNCEV